MRVSCPDAGLAVAQFSAGNVSRFNQSGSWTDSTPAVKVLAGGSLSAGTVLRTGQTLVLAVPASLATSFRVVAQTATTFDLTVCGKVPTATSAVLTVDPGYVYKPRAERRSIPRTKQVASCPAGVVTKRSTATGGIADAPAVIGFSGGSRSLGQFIEFHALAEVNSDTHMYTQVQGYTLPDLSASCVAAALLAMPSATDASLAMDALLHPRPAFRYQFVLLEAPDPNTINWMYGYMNLRGTDDFLPGQDYTYVNYFMRTWSNVPVQSNQAYLDVASTTLDGAHVIIRVTGGQPNDAYRVFSQR